MRIGLVLPLFSGDPAKVLGFARRAEELGFDGVFAFDHFFPPGAPPDRPSLEAFSMLAAVAAVTDRVAVGTLVTRASVRPAGLLAKLTVALDDVSEGRMILGVGTGDAIDRPEHDVYGLPYLGLGVRRTHLVETIGALRALLDGRPWAGGETVPAVPGPILPPPRRPGGPPVWVGGFADAVAALAGEHADAWNGWGMSIDEFGHKAEVVRAAAAGRGRSAAATWAGIVVVGRDEDEAGAMLEARYRKGMLETNVWAGDVVSLVVWLEELAAVGAEWAILLPAGPPDRVELIATQVLPRLHDRP